jgi:hypothetical protein
MDLTATQAQAKGVAPFASREGGQTVAIVATPLNALPPPSTDGVDRLYHQLAEIHAITATKLVECACWCQSALASSPIHARAGWQRPVAEPSTTRTTSPPADFSPQGSPWQ